MAAALAINLRRLLLFVGILLAGPALALMSDDVSLDGNWRTASRASAGLAPPAASTPEAVIQVYGARTMRWRGAFAVHTWIAVKPEGADRYTTYEIIGWRTWGNGNGLVRSEGLPDRNWYGSAPEVYAELRGPEAARAIPEIEAAVAAYPYTREYRTWPGPNSNTFTAAVPRRVPPPQPDSTPTPRPGAPRAATSSWGGSSGPCRSRFTSEARAAKRPKPSPCGDSRTEAISGAAGPKVGSVSCSMRARDAPPWSKSACAPA